ncbi:hypothetical protein BDR05DRAFT_865367, partial [Suillus weaverae]
ELAWLPYFNPVHMTIIDPMYCFLLGIIKTQWFNAWIQTNVLRQKTAKVDRELDQIYDLLSTFEMTSWVARLPDQVGYPAGGSLMSDEWKGLALVFCPVVIPLIWEEWYPKHKVQHDKDIDKRDKRERARVRRVAAGRAAQNRKDDDPVADPKEIMMHPDDADNFLNLAAALKIILGRITLTVTQIHPKQVKPLHHWVTHIFSQLQDYGPVYGFWTFLFERLNKVLKSYSTNNHGDGEIEISFFCAFSRDTELRTMV